MPLLPTRRRPLWQLRKARARHYPADHTSGIRLQRALAVEPEILVVLSGRIFRLWLPLGSLAQELAPLPVKSAVFDDGLLCMAFSAVGTLRRRTLGCLSLLFPIAVLVLVSAAVGAILSPGRPRPSDVKLRAACHEMTRAPTPAQLQCVPPTCQSSKTP